MRPCTKSRHGHARPRRCRVGEALHGKEYPTNPFESHLIRGVAGGAQSCELAVPIARAHVGASGSPMAGWKRLGELYPTMPFGEAVDGGRGGNRYRAGRLRKIDNF